MFTQRAREPDLISPINAIRIVKAKDINYYPGSDAARRRGPAVCSHAGRGATTPVSIIFYNYIISMSDLD